MEIIWQGMGWPIESCFDDFICDTCNSWDDDLQAGICECCRLEIA